MSWPTVDADEQARPTDHFCRLQKRKPINQTETSIDRARKALSCPRSDLNNRQPEAVLYDSRESSPSLFSPILLRIVRHTVDSAEIARQFQRIHCVDVLRAEIQLWMRREARQSSAK